VKVFSLDFLLRKDLNPVQLPQLRDVVKHLEPVVLSVLDGIEAQVELCEKRQVFNEDQLPYFSDLV